MDKEIIKRLKLSDELDNAIKQIIMALKELQTSVKETAYYFIIFQLLANGFERLMKCSICYGYLARKNRFPTTKEIKTHNIVALLKTFIDDYFSQRVPVLHDDYDFLCRDKELKILIELLSQFSSYERYHNLNVVTGEEQSIDIKDVWQKLESDFIMKDPILKKCLFEEPDYEYIDNVVTQHFVSIFEKTVRAIVRQFTLGELGEEPRRYIGYYSHFLGLRDEQIGTTDYHKKFFHRELKIPPKYKHNRTRKQKTIRMEDYEKLWPFKNVKEVLVEKSSDGCIFIVINKKVYALNGITATKYNIPFPHDYKETYQGRSTGDFTNLALSL